MSKFCRHWSIVPNCYNIPMGYPTLKEEQKLWQKGYKVVACIDEVGRGPLAGPVMACAVALRKFSIFNFPARSRQATALAGGQFPKLKDSKKLSPRQRSQLYDVLTNHPCIRWGIGKIYPKTIDRINIYHAAKLAMTRALHNLEKKLSMQKSCDRTNSAHIAGYLILDGNMALDVAIPQKAIVKADEKVFSCAAASIIAKVTRDRLMLKLHKKYPLYGFDRHKGYGTRLHFEMLKKHGPCEAHRQSFQPIAVYSMNSRKTLIKKHSTF